MMKISISQQDFGTLCICALRYCHGRKTYMPSLVQDIVRAHFEDLSDKDLGVIANDEEYQQRFDLFGMECDERDWKRFYGDLKEWREERDACD